MEEENKPGEEEYLEKAREPEQKACEWHQKFRGKYEGSVKAPIRELDDFSVWYTPGVAAPCREIADQPRRVFEYTNKWNNVAIVTDGSRVLGLGDIGPEASLPVMEGKAMLFKHLGGVSAFPLPVDTTDPEEIITTVKRLAPAFGGINLEDIATPKCFHILEQLRSELDIPVWHDDQQGTAAVELAGIINSLKIVEKELSEVKFSIVGAGAANIALCRILEVAGADPGKFYVADSTGILHRERNDLRENRAVNPYKWELARKTNRANRTGKLEEAIRGTDVLVAASRPVPGTIKGKWITEMNEDPVVFAVANPLPEIWPWEAKEAGARIVGTGRSDFPNQINNSLGFPGIFRGALDVGASTITDEMAIAAGQSIAETAESAGLEEDKLIPTMDEKEVFINTAVAVGKKAMEQGIAERELSAEELSRKATKLIDQAQKQTELITNLG